MKYKLYPLILLYGCTTSFAQVGIGTENPIATLDIKSNPLGVIKLFDF